MFGPAVWTSIPKMVRLIFIPPRVAMCELREELKCGVDL